MKALPPYLSGVHGVQGEPATAPFLAHETDAGTALQKIAFASPAEEQQARERYEVIRPLIEFRPEEAQQLLLPGQQRHTLTTLNRAIALANGQSEATLWRWMKRFQRGGLPALADRQRKDQGTSRWFSDPRHEKARNFAIYVYIEQRQSLRCAHEALARDRERLGIAESDLPSYSTVRAFLQGLPEPMKVLAREGRRAYRERMAPYVSRGYTEAANQIWVSDHMIHDVEAMNDCFDGQPFGAPIRLRFTAIIDLRSRYVVGASWCWDGSSASIATALRHAVQRYGPCEVFYCDNGKDYLKVAKGAMPAYLLDASAPQDWATHELERIEETGILKRLGIAVQHCIVRHPQSKHVERFFRTVHARFDSKFPTYTGGSPATRPDFTAEAMAQHRKLLRMGLPGQSLHPPASLVIRMALAWIHDDYHHRPHSGKGMNGRTPAEVFAAERNSKQRPAPSERELALMLAEREQCKVRECSVTLKKRRYIGETEEERALLHELNDQQVVVAYDPLELEQVAILDLNGYYLCGASVEQLLPQSSQANDAIAQSMAERRRLERRTADGIVAIAQTARAEGARSEVELLAQRVAVSPVDAVLTQRRPRLVEAKSEAVAPPSAAEIGEEFWEGLK